MHRILKIIINSETNQHMLFAWKKSPEVTEGGAG